MRVLVVEDDARIAGFICKGLREEGHVVDHCEDGRAGLQQLTGQEYDVAVIDIMLPERDGLSLIREARRRGEQTPILILSAKSHVDARVEGLRAGADDYLTKPFSFAELVARLDALHRRAGTQGGPKTLRLGDLELDLASRRAYRQGEEIELQSKELALLEYFLQNEGRVLSKTMILERVWGYQFDPQTNVVDVLVHRLRKKVDHPFENKLIHTIRGVGYVLRDD